jgi:hypothetical protein
MPTLSARQRRARTHVIAAELINIAGAAGAALAVLALGAAMSRALPGPAAPWLFAGAYAAPGAIAFAAYWWIAQRL